MVVGRELVGEGVGEVVLDGSDGGKESTGSVLILEGVVVVGEEDSTLVGEVVGVVVVGSMLVDKDSLMGIRIRTSWLLQEKQK